MATLTLPQGIGGVRAALSARTSALLVLPWEVSHVRSYGLCGTAEVAVIALSRRHIGAPDPAGGHPGASQLQHIQHVWIIGALGALQQLQSMGRCLLREDRAGDHFPVG